MISLIIGVAVASLISYYIYQYYLLRKLTSKIHGPRSYPIIGNLLQMKWDPADMFEQQAGVCQMFINPRMWLMWLGPVPVLFIGGANEAEPILSSNKHINKALQYKFLEPWMGLGLLTSYAEKWRPRRKLLTPTFHYDILKDFVDVFNAQAKVMVKKMQETIGKGPQDYYQYITLCALDIICESAMGKHVNAQDNKNSDYVRAVYKINDIIHERQKSPWFYLDFTFNLFGRGKEHQWCLDILHGFTLKVIKERCNIRNSMKKSASSNGLISADGKTSAEANNNLAETDSTSKGPKKRLAFLDLLLQMADENKLTFKDIREEVDTFMFEGHDTTTAGMNWTLFLLGCYPEAQAKVHQELDDLFGEEDREITYDDLKHLEYLECCVKESLRLYPSVPMYARKLEEPLDICGYVVPPGVTVSILPYAVHRDERHWPDPEIFDPERFRVSTASRRHAYAYIPFSAGARNCIGQRFAIMEEKTVLAWILRYYTIRSCQRRDHIRPKEELILRPSESMRLELQLRRVPKF